MRADSNLRRMDGEKISEVGEVVVGRRDGGWGAGREGGRERQNSCFSFYACTAPLRQGKAKVERMI